MGYQKALLCEKCGSAHSPSHMLYQCEKCGGFLKVIYDYPHSIGEDLKSEADAKKGATIMERWKSVLPIDQEELIDRVTLGEKETPLLKVPRLGEKLGLNRLFVKCEHLFPTASLKDRSMPLVVLKALEYGGDTVSIVSSGNAAASLSAYAAKAGLKTVIFVRGGASPSKLVKAAICGAILVRVDGHLSQLNDIFIKMRDTYGWYDCDGGVNPYRCEGKKTCAYEIAAQMNWQVADWIIIPTSTGNGLVAAGIGFTELYEMGLISKKPRLVAVQLKACSPIYDAYLKGQDEITPVVPAVSISDTLLNGNPDAGKTVLHWIKTTGGTVAAVSDQEVLEAIRILAEQTGVFQEAAGAVTVAAAKKLRVNGVINPAESVVCLVTGSGLNQQDLAVDITKLPPAVEPTQAAVEKYLKTLTAE